MKKIFLTIFLAICLISLQSIWQSALASTTNDPQNSKSFTREQIKKIPILMFHYVRHVDSKKDLLGYNLSVEKTFFEKILSHLSDEGYQSVHLQSILQDEIPEKPIVLSFDDGYQDFFTNALPLLKKYHFTASEAIISGKLDGKQYMTPEEIKSIAADGIEILAHTVHHLDLTATLYAKDEIERSKNDLEAILGMPITGIVYPAGKYNDDTISLVKKAGYQFALSERPGYADVTKRLFELRRIRIDNRDGYKGFLNKLKNR